MQVVGVGVAGTRKKTDFLTPKTKPADRPRAEGLKYSSAFKACFIQANLWNVERCNYTFHHTFLFYTDRLNMLYFFVTKPNLTKLVQSFGNMPVKLFTSNDPGSIPPIAFKLYY